jgi:hypothetical protein
MKYPEDVGKPASLRRPDLPSSLQDHALDNLAFIRSTMERAGSFTAVPGAGGVLMGLSAIGAAGIASHQLSREAWLAVWIAEAVVAGIIGGIAMAAKARKSGVSLLAGPGKKFALSFAPPLVAGALLTWPLFLTGRMHLLAAMWLLLYGAAIIAGSSHSVVVVLAMGLSFMVLGAVTLALPTGWRDLPLAAGFGGLHLFFGGLILRRYGG